MDTPSIVNVSLDTWYEQVMFYIFLMIVLGLVSWLLIKFFKAVFQWLKHGGRIQGKGLSISNPVSDTVGTPPVPVPIHASCPHVGDILSIIARTTEFVETRHRIPVDVIEKQMKYYEEKEVEITGYFLRIFIKELDSYLPQGTEIVQHQEYLAYSATLLAVGRVVKDYIRTVMRQNHFAELEGDDWIDKKVRYRTMVLEKATELLNVYWRGEIVPRWVLYKINHEPEITKQLNVALDDLFDYARNEARSMIVELTKLREGYEAFLKRNITG